MRGIRGFAASAVVGCAFVVAGSAGANKPAPSIAAPLGRAAPAGYIIVGSGSLSSPAGSQTFGSVSCPVGTVVWGGGVAHFAGNPGRHVNSSWPLGTKGWQGWVSNASGSDTAFFVEAICAKAPAGYQIVTKTFSNPAPLQSTGVARCPATKLPLAGGAFSSSRRLDVNINSTYPLVSSLTGWITDMSNRSLTDAKMTAYVICATKPGPTGYEIVGVTQPNPAGVQSNSAANCPASKVPTGGGVYSTSKETSVNITFTHPYPSGGSPVGWAVGEENASGIDALTRAYVICVS